ncbi:hypothetical protein EF847_14125 [Actinobacteria bacterium YIM 96077]|uniref:Uncharacterized protein n=1 Tax=Phytoactinopolyspora halophila TaxID=1981511 RepID=A0A329QFJ5_9ACTN|nr:hypothetical protein [Phytoactinopolyspora halophila]AYY13661.1 hypothetical protein EF847_14125 [Actinobacteria bacterium YIM 96077]RAW11225.1 hypothetical protein DPM12_17035 [Phytoactinopolyspora halophila]
MSTGRDDDQTWSELVEAFHAEPDPDDAQRRWPEAEDLDPDDVDTGPTNTYPGASHTWGENATDDPVEGQPGDDTPAAARPWRATPQEPAGTQLSDDDHFVPPAPPPLPRGDRVSRWAWTGLIAAPSVLLLSAILQWTPPDQLMLVLVGGFIAGFVTLVARMRGRNPHDPDDGAVV